jgi:hypothetical protein
MANSSGSRPDVARHRAPDASTAMIRIIVKLRPEQYDALFRHVREIGSSISAFGRESLVKALGQELATPAEHDTQALGAAIEK